MSSSGQSTPASRSSVNPRAIALSAISFFIGVQFTYLKDLFASNIGESLNPDAGWAPDDIDTATKQTGVQVTRPESRAERRRERQRRAGEKGGVPNKKKKKERAPRLFEMKNYTDFEPLPWSLPKPKPVRFQTSEQFMSDYIAAKREQNIPLPWEQKAKYAHKPVSLPFPIISLNFPKSATLTMKSYFDCGGITSIHTSTQDGRIAICMLENMMEGKPPMDRCNTHKIRDDSREVVPIDFISDIGLQGPPCFYSSLHDGGLDHIAEHYPEGTILLVTRNASSWYRSMSKWGTILHRWRKYCEFDGRVEGGRRSRNMEYWNEMYKMHNAEEYWVNFYHAHTQKIREFAMKHLSMTYVEVELENKNMATILEAYTKVPPRCVMDCHPGPKWVSQHNTTSRCHPIGQTPPLKDEFLKQQAIQEEEEEEEEDGDEDEDGTEDDDDDNTDDDASNEESEE